MKRQKPLPHAGAALGIVIMNWNRFQEHTGRRWHALHGNFTPCGSHRLPSLPATAHGPADHFNARTETGQSYLPDMRVIASRPATACLCADGCSPYPSFLKAGSWPAHSHTAFLSDAYRTYPMDLFNYRTVASPHRHIVVNTPVPIGGGVETSLNLRDVLLFGWICALIRVLLGVESS